MIFIVSSGFIRRNAAYIVTLIFTLMLFSCTSSDEQIIAVVGNNKISSEEFENRYIDYIATTGVDDNLRTRMAILNNMINEILLKEYDDNEGVYANEEFKKEKEWIFKQNLLAFLKDREIYGGIEVSNKELRDAFIKMNQTLTARHLYAKDEEEAEQLYQLLQTGATFDELAQQVFTDSTLRNNGGFIGSFTWGEMDPAFEDAAYELEVNEISKPVKTRTGYSIIKLEEKEFNPLLTEYQYQQKKREIETAIKIRKKNPSERNFIESVFDRKALDIKSKGVEETFKFLRGNNNETENQDKIKNKTVAIYKNEVYDVNDVLTRIKNLPEYHRSNINTTKKLTAAIEGFVAQDILIAEAEERGYDKNKIMLRNYETMMNNLFLKFKAQEIAEKSEVEDSVLRNYYNEHLNFFSTHDEINIQEIIVADKNLAADIYRKLQSGENFGKLAKKYSLREWSAKNDGEIGFAPISKFGILKVTLWESSVGEIIAPQKIDDYFGIFKILGKRKSEPIAYEDIEQEVLDVYKNDRKNQLLFDYIDHLKEEIKVQVNEKLLSSLTFDLPN